MAACRGYETIAQKTMHLKAAFYRMCRHLHVHVSASVFKKAAVAPRAPSGE